MAKMTKKEMFAAIRKMVIDNDEMLEFIDHEIELLNRKTASSKKPTARQLENVELQAAIVSYLTAEDMPKTIKELQAGIPEISELSNQRVTHLLKALRENGTVVRTYEKKVPYFSVA